MRGVAEPVASTPRGQARRAALVSAAAAILETDGFAALTHRAVAARAGLPLAATTYYFKTRGDLVESAVRELGEPYRHAARARVAEFTARRSSGAALAAAIVDVVAGASGGDVDRLLNFYERYVQAGRDPRVRTIVAAWTDELVELVGQLLRRAGHPADRDAARRLVALVDGLLLTGVVSRTANPFADARRQVRIALRGVG